MGVILLAHLIVLALLHSAVVLYLVDQLAHQQSLDTRIDNLTIFCPKFLCWLGPLPLSMVDTIKVVLLLSNWTQPQRISLPPTHFNQPPIPPSASQDPHSPNPQFKKNGQILPFKKNAIPWPKMVETAQNQSHPTHATTMARGSCGYP